MPRGPKSSEWKRLPLALIALVDGLLVIVTYSIRMKVGIQSGRKKCRSRIDNLVREMREGHEFKATDFRGGDSSLPPLKPAEKGDGVGIKKKCLKPSRRFGKASDEPGCSTQTPQRPIRPRRGIRKQAEPRNLLDKEQELKEWIRVELKTQLGKLLNEIFDWLHHDREARSRFRKTRGGKTNETTVMLTLPAWKFQRSDVRTVVMVLMKLENVGLIGEGGDESPISGLNLLAEEVENGTWSDNVYKDPQENSCRMLTVWPHHESYVLPEDVTEEQAGKASPTNSEDYKTPPEDDPMTESRTPDVGMTKRSRYLTRSSKKAELEGKCIPISSTKKDDLQTKRIPRRSIKIGGVYTPDKRLKTLFQSCKKPKYTSLAELEKAQFQEFQKILRENPE
ncbi:hypothetical protein Bca52824_035014 [Brassica carinata]|uniref:Uncharacterized protein n=1 Tax=Brassica carinata TaxID=52824 RepID=A0A8X7S2L9_BRACI|nr:hypothetical protein Bca52824_035014 [Brassica carinata]